MNLNAQSASVSNVLKLRSAKQTGQIIENDKLVGYYIFYFKEKSDKKTSTYEVELFDDNYNSMNSFEVTRPKNSLMLEMVYNGEAFMLFFWDRKNGYEFTTYDKSGKKMGSKLIPRKEIPSFDLQASTASLSSGTENNTVFPLGTKGFVRQTYTKNKKMKELWRKGSSPTSKLIHTADISEISEDFFTATVYTKKGYMTKKWINHLLSLMQKTETKLLKLTWVQLIRVKSLF